MKKLKGFDNFLHRHFKHTCHSPDKVSVQPVKKIIYDENSTSKFNIFEKHETKLKWVKLLQTLFLLGLNDNMYHEGNITKMPDFDVFSLFGMSEA